jgi:AmiR/NasT family two-component response regulator
LLSNNTHSFVTCLLRPCYFFFILHGIPLTLLLPSKAIFKNDMKIIVVGSQTTIKRIIPSLSGEGIEAIGMSASLDKLPYLLKETEFDMAIVDSRLKEPRSIHHLISRVWGTPVVFIVGPTKSDWAKLKPLDAHGYIQEGVGKAELVACIKAIHRRFSKGNGSAQTNLAHEDIGEIKNG